jgi:hypothetical protein
MDSSNSNDMPSSFVAYCWCCISRSFAKPFMATSSKSTRYARMQQHWQYMQLGHSVVSCKANSSGGFPAS